MTRNDHNVFCQEIGAEAILYHSSSHRCLHLPPIAAFVWKELATPHSLERLTASFRQAFPEHAREASAHVLEALAQLEEQGLLHSDTQESLPETDRWQRRRVLQTLGLAALTSTLVPAPAAAASFQVHIVSAEYGADPLTKAHCNSTAGTDPSGPAFFDKLSPVNAAVQPSGGNIYASNTALAGDPLVGIYKELRVVYTVNGATYHRYVCENFLLSITPGDFTSQEYGIPV